MSNLIQLAALKQITSELREIQQSQAILELIIEAALANLICEATNKPEADFPKLMKNLTPIEREQLQKLKTDLVQQYMKELTARSIFLNALKKRIETA